MKSKFYQLHITLTTLAVVGFATLPAQAALLVSSSGTKSVKQYDETTGAFKGDFVASGSGGLSSPEGLVFGPNGNLFVADETTNSVLEYNGTTGSFVSDFVPSGSGALFRPQGLTFGPDGNLYVSTSSQDFTNRVLKFDGTRGTFLSAIPIVTAPSSASGAPLTTGLAFGTDGNLYAGSGPIYRDSEITDDGQVVKYNLATKNLSTLARVNGPKDLTFGPDGNLYVSKAQTSGRDPFPNLVSKVNPTTGAAASFIPFGPYGGTTPFNGKVFSPVGLVFDSDGNLLLSSSNTNSVEKFNGNTGDFIGDFIPSGSGGLSNPQYLTFSPHAVPEPVPQSSLGFLAFGALLSRLALKRKQQQKARGKKTAGG
jgi:DNA-binding beta-propeller fold protein YncE